MRFFPLSPDRVKRTSALDGLQRSGSLLARASRTRAPGGPAGHAYAADAAPVARPPNESSRLLVDPCRRPRARASARPCRSCSCRSRGMPDARSARWRLYRDGRRASSSSSIRRSTLSCGTIVSAWPHAGRRASSRASRPACWTRSCSPRTPVVRAAADGVWITWCDQVAVHPATVRAPGVDLGGASDAAAGDADRSTARTRTSISSATRTAESSACSIAAKATDARRRRERHGPVRAVARQRSSSCCRATRGDVDGRPATGERNSCRSSRGGRAARRRDVPVRSTRWKPSASTRRRSSRSVERYLAARDGAAARERRCRSSFPRTTRSASSARCSSRSRGRSRAARRRARRSSSSTTARAIGRRRSSPAVPACALHRHAGQRRQGQGRARRASSWRPATT